MKKLILSAVVVLAAHVSHALEVGEHAPCVMLNQIAPTGTEAEHCIRDPNVKGQVVVQEFFSVTCSDCLESFGPMNQVAAELGMKSTFRLISVDRDEKEVRTFINANRNVVTHEVALDSARDAKQAYGVVETPTIFILDSQNTVIYKHAGIVTAPVAAEIKAAVLSVP